MASLLPMLCRGRLKAVRTLLCIALLVMAMPLAAQAAPPDPPVLTGTNPASPSAPWQEFAFQPFVQGSVDGVVISGWRQAIEATGPLTRAAGGSESVVTIYDDRAACEAGDGEAAVGEGSAAELKEPGIQVAEGIVEADSETTFYATLRDEASGEPSKCSNGIVYRQVSSPPAAPELTAIAPTPPADDNHPRLFGVADSEATVSIYPSASCPSGGFPTGAPLASGSGAQFATEGIPVSVPDNSTTMFSAAAFLAGFSSTCSSSTITYTEQTLESPGGGEGGGGEEAGGGGAGGGGAGGGGGSPQPGLPGPNPPGKPPAPKLGTAPAGTANDNTPSITGKAPDAVRVEVFGSAGCSGPVVAEGSAAQLSSGLPVQVPDNTTRTFFGISIDGGGDRSPCSEEPVVYVEDSTAPRTRITSGPGVKTHKSTVLFRFADVDQDLSAHFLCKLDRRQWSDCSSPLRLKRLGHRRHLFRVKAVDAAGNREQAGTKRSFRVVGR